PRDQQAAVVGAKIDRGKGLAVIGKIAPVKATPGSRGIGVCLAAGFAGVRSQTRLC
ncbi:MAG: hypothetical protein RJA19_1886, partial [Bacteroidota bacterium]